MFRKSMTRVEPRVYCSVVYVVFSASKYTLGSHPPEFNHKKVKKIEFRIHPSLITILKFEGNLVVASIIPALKKYPTFARKKSHLILWGDQSWTPTFVLPGEVEDSTLARALWNDAWNIMKPFEGESVRRPQRKNLCHLRWRVECIWRWLLKRRAGLWKRAFLGG